MHLHTNYSDGSDAPERVVERAAQLGLAAVAITDHDTLAGVEEARAAAQFHGLEFLSGVEISAEYDGIEVHIVGLGVDPHFAPLIQMLDELCRQRTARADAILERLSAAGVPVTKEALQARCPHGALGRIHIAQEVKRLGYAKTVQEAFDKYIGRGQRAFVKKEVLTCPAAIDGIHRAGGLAILAHPGLHATKRLISNVLHFDFDGIEAYHIQHTPGQVTQFLTLAEEYGLIVSGGSDCHGSAKGKKGEMGKVLVPYSHFYHIKSSIKA